MDNKICSIVFGIFMLTFTAQIMGSIAGGINVEQACVRQCSCKTEEELEELIERKILESKLYSSCEEIKNAIPSSASGDYDLLIDGNKIKVYCNMDTLPCDGKGGWTRIAHLDMSNPSEQCPPGFKLYEQSGVRACGRSGSGCQSVKFPSNSISYTQVCGRVIGYEVGSPDALRYIQNRNNIDKAYIDGVSVTQGTPRQHIWTFIATLQDKFFLGGTGEYSCPCANPPKGTISPPSFVGNDYYCEAGTTRWPFGDSSTFHYGDPLWDGKQCGGVETGCCQAPSMPWFHKTMPQPSTDFIELRVCCDESNSDEDAPVGLYEIYVK